MSSKIDEINARIDELKAIKIPDKIDDCIELCEKFGGVGKYTDTLEKEIASQDRTIAHIESLESEARRLRERLKFDRLAAYQRECREVIDREVHRLKIDIDYQNALKAAEKQELVRKILDL